MDKKQSFVFAMAKVYGGESRRAESQFADLDRLYYSLHSGGSQGIGTQ
jgi:hypothetical protein